VDSKGLPWAQDRSTIEDLLVIVLSGPDEGLKSDLRLAHQICKLVPSVRC
jgi:hypothetical protein